jgi:hypothetical protein
VLDRYLLHCVNDPAPLQWSEWSPAGLGPNHEVIRPAATPAEPQPTFEKFLSAVTYPSWADAAGHILVAYAAESVGTPEIHNLYGIFDMGAAAGDARFAGRLMARLPGPPSGVASWQGRIALVCTGDGAGVAHVHRFDAQTGVLAETALPPGPGSWVSWPTFTSASSAVAMRDSVLIETKGLKTWTVLPGVPAGLQSLAVDLAERPPAVHVGTYRPVYVVRESGGLVTAATGLPAESRATQLRVVQDQNGRWIYLGSWAWSVWRARLG